MSSWRCLEYARDAESLALLVIIRLILPYSYGSCRINEYPCVCHLLTPKTRSMTRGAHLKLRLGRIFTTPTHGAPSLLSLPTGRAGSQASRFLLSFRTGRGARLVCRSLVKKRAHGCTVRDVRLPVVATTTLRSHFWLFRRFLFPPGTENSPRKIESRTTEQGRRRCVGE